MILNSAGGVPGVAARGRANLGYQPDRVIRGKRGYKAVPSWLSRETGASEGVFSEPASSPHVRPPLPQELSSLYPFHLMPILRDPHIAVQCDSAKARNWPCWGLEV